MARVQGNIAGRLALAAAALALNGCETVVERVADTYRASLFGAEEVPGPGDPDGSGSAEVSIADEINQFCYEIKKVRGLDDITAAHIHRGAKGEAGPPVVALDPPTGGGSKGCPNVAEALADEIEADPSAFYINVHTKEFPEGAIRGQLSR